MSTCSCVPLYLRFKASFSLASEYLVVTSVLLLEEGSPSIRDVFGGSGRFFMGRRVIFVSFSDQH